jgi:CheY-like chemotaxis protein
MPRTILIADDDSTMTNLFMLDAETRDVDIRIKSAGSGEETIELMARMKPDLIVLDIRMPKGDGFTVLEHLKKNKIDIPVVIVTNYRTDAYVEKSKTYAQVKDYIIKHETRIDRIINTVGSHLA